MNLDFNWWTCFCISLHIGYCAVWTLGVPPSSFVGYLVVVCWSVVAVIRLRILFSSHLIYGCVFVCYFAAFSTKVICWPIQRAPTVKTSHRRRQKKKINKRNKRCDDKWREQREFYIFSCHYFLSSLQSGVPYAKWFRLEQTAFTPYACCVDAVFTWNSSFIGGEKSDTSTFGCCCLSLLNVQDGVVVCVCVRWAGVESHIQKRAWLFVDWLIEFEFRRYRVVLLSPTMFLFFR